MVESHRERNAVVVVVDGLLRERVTDAETASSQYLAAQTARG